MSEKVKTASGCTVEGLVRQHALKHIKPLRTAKLLECHAVNRLVISVTFLHDGCEQTHLVGIGIPLQNSILDRNDQPNP